MGKPTEHCSRLETSSRRAGGRKWARASSHWTVESFVASRDLFTRQINCVRSMTCITITTFLKICALYISIAKCLNSRRGAGSPELLSFSARQANVVQLNTFDYEGARLNGFKWVQKVGMRRCYINITNTHTQTNDLFMCTSVSASDKRANSEKHDFYSQTKVMSGTWNEGKTYTKKTAKNASIQSGIRHQSNGSFVELLASRVYVYLHEPRLVTSHSWAIQFFFVSFSFSVCYLCYKCEQWLPMTPNNKIVDVWRRDIDTLPMCRTRSIKLIAAKSAN